MFRTLRASSLLVLALSSPVALGGTLYVDANLNTGLGDGSTWADAFQGPDGLQAALAVAMPGDQVFVAQGTYLPTNSGGRAASFNLISQVEIYGSFLGGEATPADRPPFGTAPSVLSGDLNGDDGGGNVAENSFHPVRGAGVDATAVLDGFQIRGGNANGSGNNDRGGGILCRNGASPTVRNCHFVDNRCMFGGGAGYINASAPAFIDCIFEDNQGGSFGGAFDIATSGAVLFDRCVFVANRAARAGALEVFSTNGVVVSNSVFLDNVATGSGGGGALWIGSGSDTLVVNCSVVGNSAVNQAAGGLRNQGAAAVVRNSILWGNTGQGGAQGPDNQITPGVDVTYSIVEGGYAGTGNLSADPAFADAAGGDLSLTLASPAIDAGDNAQVPAGATLDLALAARFADEPDVADTGSGSAPIVDMGAYESSLVVVANYCQVSPNSAGPGAIIGATGSTSIAGNGFGLVTTGVPTNVFGLYYYGVTELQAPFGDGVRCVGTGGVGTFRLYPLVQADGTGTTTRAIDFTIHPTGAGDGAITPGSTWKFQLWFRDQAAGGAGFNTSDGLSVTFAP